MTAILAAVPVSGFADNPEELGTAIERAVHDAGASCVNLSGKRLKACRETATAALSGRICNLGYWKDDVLDEVKKQKKYSKVGGVVNLTMMQALQLRLRAIDDKISEIMTELKSRGLLATPCTDKTLRDLVKTVDLCESSQEEPECKAMKPLLSWIGQDDEDGYVNDTSYYMPTNF